MLEEVCNETGADREQVGTEFEVFLAAVLEKDHWKKDDVNNADTVVKNTEGRPPAPEEPGAKLVETDIAARGEVEGLGQEEALNPDTQVSVSLTEETSEGLDPSYAATKTCARCQHETTDLVCEKCTGELKSLAYMDMGDGEGHSAEYMQDEFLNNTDFDRPGESQGTPFRCTICGNEESSREAAIAHVEDDHADVLQRQQEEAVPEQEPAYASTKEAIDQDPAEVAPLPQSPADRFEEYVNDLANRAAAQQFSAVDDATIHSLASQLGADEDEVRASLHTVSIFGNYVGSNGQLVDESFTPEGYQEVGVEGVGGRVAAREALVPTDMVISKVAEEMNMEQDLAYDYIRDKYGDDLPTTYHASVQGELHFYLPAELAVAAQQEQMSSQPMDPNAGPSLAPGQNTPAAAMPAAPPRF
jgi:hypothetical protein